MKNKNIIVSVIVAIVIAGAAFYGGMMYEKSSIPDFGNNRGQFARNGQGGAMNRAGQADFVSGEIISKDDKSVTLKMRDGGSKIIFISDQTKISKLADGTKDDLASGKQVIVNGKTNTDGSLNAETINLAALPVGPAPDAVDNNNPMK